VNSASSAPSWWPASNWNRSDINISAVAIAANALVATYAKTATTVGTFGGGQTIAVPEATDWYVGVLRKSDGQTIWETQLPDVGTNLKGEPLFEGLAIDRNGYIIVVQRNGNVLCYGGGVVSVAQRETMEPHYVASVNPAPGPAVAGPGPTASASASPQSRAQPATAMGPTVEQAAPAPVARGSRVVLPTPSRDDGSDNSAQADIDTSDMVAMPGGHRVPRSSQGEWIQRTMETMRAPADMAWKCATPCLTIASVTASSTSGKSNSARNTFDKDLRTRWSPKGSGEQ
jgi:hypothetical protein